MKKHDLIVIGSGPGGYTAALRAAQLGMDVACIDENEASGGTCLRVGCIPSKSLLESSHWYDQARSGALARHGVMAASVTLDLDAMQRRKERVVETLTKGIASLFTKNKVTRYVGRARFTSAGQLEVVGADGTVTVAAQRILIATGSKTAGITGFDMLDGAVSTSSEALAFEQVPDRLVVIGAGYIGLEIGSVWNRLGAEVTVLEYADRILPGLDGEIARQAQTILERQGLRFIFGAQVQNARRVGEQIAVDMAGGSHVQGDQVLLAVGRKPNTDGLGLKEIGVAVNDRGFIEVDEKFQSNVPGVYAVGDVIGGAMLAHKAEKEGIACVEGMAGHSAWVNYDTIPAVVFTEPEIASVGPTEEALIAEGRAYRKGKFPFLANGRARTLDAAEGMVKVLADENTDRVLAVHIVGPRAGDIIAEAGAAIEFGASSEDLFLVTHAHPTLAEAFKEAALAVHNRPIHI